MWKSNYLPGCCHYSVQYLLTLLEPLLIIVLGIVVGGIVISLYLPIFTLMGHLA